MRFKTVCLLMLLIAAPAMVSGDSVTNPNVEATRFNPMKGESGRLTYSLSDSAKVRVRVYNSDDVLIRTLVDWQSRPHGTQTEVWNGRDDKDVVVPDEAYYFTIEADRNGTVSVYDPVVASGGDELELTDLSYDEAFSTLTFRLDRPSRVMVRAGLVGGPLMRTPIDWMPFDKGTHSVAWDGKDENRICSIGGRSDLKLYGYGYVLPACTVLTTGNTSLSYREYMKSLPRTAVRKQPVTPEVRKTAISPFWGQSPRYSRAIRFSLSEVDIVDGKLSATVSIDPEDVALLRGVAYEWIAYVDSDLVLDDDRGKTPYKFSLDLSEIPPGEHTLTVNVASVTDRVGAQSAVFQIQGADRQ